MLRLLPALLAAPCLVLAACQPYPSGYASPPVQQYAPQQAAPVPYAPVARAAAPRQPAAATRRYRGTFDGGRAELAVAPGPYGSTDVVYTLSSVGGGCGFSRMGMGPAAAARVRLTDREGAGVVMLERTTAGWAFQAENPLELGPSCTLQGTISRR